MSDNCEKSEMKKLLERAIKKSQEPGFCMYHSDPKHVIQIHGGCQPAACITCNPATGMPKPDLANMEVRPKQLTSSPIGPKIERSQSEPETPKQ